MAARSPDQIMDIVRTIFILVIVELIDVVRDPLKVIKELMDRFSRLYNIRWTSKIRNNPALQ